MIVITELEITSFTFDERTLNWEIESTTEAINDYELDIYRAEFNPQEDVLTNMVLIASGINAEDYDYTDSGISGLEFHQHREFYYAVVPINEMTGEEGDYAGPETVITTDDRWTRVIKLEQNLGFRHTARPLFILKKKTFGTFCSECYDETAGRQSKSHCSDCYDTGFTGGYYSSIMVSGIVNASVKRQQQMEWGQWQPEDAMVTLEAYPVMKPDDVIIDRLNRRWTVIDVRPTMKALSLIIQNCHIRILPKDDIVYEIWVPNLRDYD